VTTDASTTIMPVLPLLTVPEPADLAAIEAKSSPAGFGDRKVLDRVSLFTPAGLVTALIGPLGLRQVDFPADFQSDARADPQRDLRGEDRLSGSDIYDSQIPDTHVQSVLRGIDGQSPFASTFPTTRRFFNVTRTSDINNELQKSTLVKPNSQVCQHPEVLSPFGFQPVPVTTSCGSTTIQTP
jgi:hypothetical protein